MIKKLISRIKELISEMNRRCPVPGGFGEYELCPCGKEERERWVASGGICRFGDNLYEGENALEGK
jgi:hypothetical protein